MMWQHFYVVAVLISALFLTARGRSVCYDDIGCFDSGSPFYDLPDRPVSWLPESREQVGTVFRLNTRNNPDPNGWQELSTYDSMTLTNSYFSASRETKIIIHGYNQAGNVDWMAEMMTAFMNHGDYNVIRVDWTRGAIDLYGISAANSRIVGAEMSLLIDQLKTQFGVTADSFHIIGHSLGAHAAGYTGERQKYPSVARITGLDPAGPYFEDMDPVVRLDPNDATFVDVIHSDTDPIYTLGYGMYAPCGHMDFFPNGGRKQPGCDQGFFEFVGSEGGFWDGTVQFVACNHLRAIDLFTESINSQCVFRSFQCTRDHDDYNYGLCFDNGISAEMGWNAPLDYPAGQTNLIYQRNTQSASPFCGYQYRFTIKLDDHRKAEKAKGMLFITLIGLDAQSQKFPLTTETMEYDYNQVYIHVGLSDVDPGQLSGLYFEWQYDADWYKWWDWEFFERPKLYIHQIQVAGAERQDSYTMCGSYDPIEPDTVTSFYPTATVCPSQ